MSRDSVRARLRPSPFLGSIRLRPVLVDDLVTKPPIVLFVIALSVRPEWLGWAILLFFLASPPAPPEDDLMPISPGRRALGYAMFAVLVSILVPVPDTLWAVARADVVLR